MYKFKVIILLTITLLLGSLTVAEAAANIKFNATEVNMTAWTRTSIYGYFYNSGNSGAYVYKAKFSVSITDYYSGNYVWSDNGDFYNFSVWVGAGATVYHTFNINNSNVPQFNGRYHWNVNNTIWWN